MKNDKFKAMSDEELVAKANSRLWISGEEGQVAAELYRRQKQREDKNLKIQSWVLRTTILAVIIAAVTLTFVIIQFFQYPAKTVKEHEKTHLNCYQTAQRSGLGTSKAIEPLGQPVENVEH